MTHLEEKALVEQAFQALKDRGWFSKTGLVPTGVTDGEIAAFEQVIVDDPSFGASWLLTSFAHDEAWDEDYWREGGCPVAPDFRTLLEWFFFGSLIPEFEAENHVKVTYQRLNNYEFLWHWYEDRWKED